MLHFSIVEEVFWLANKIITPSDWLNRIGPGLSRIPVSSPFATKTLNKHKNKQFLSVQLKLELLSNLVLCLF